MPPISVRPAGQRGELSADVEILGLHPDRGHARQPPVTGGKNATSSPGLTRVSGSAKSWFTAQRTVRRLANALAWPGLRSDQPGDQFADRADAGGRGDGLLRRAGALAQPGEVQDGQRGFGIGHGNSAWCGDRLDRAVRMYDRAGAIAIGHDDRGAAARRRGGLVAIGAAIGHRGAAAVSDRPALPDCGRAASGWWPAAPPGSAAVPARAGSSRAAWNCRGWPAAVVAGADGSGNRASPAPACSTPGWRALLLQVLQRRLRWQRAGPDIARLGGQQRRFGLLAGHAAHVLAVAGRKIRIGSRW